MTKMFSDKNIFKRKESTTDSTIFMYFLTTKLNMKILNETSLRMEYIFTKFFYRKTEITNFTTYSVFCVYIFRPFLTVLTYIFNSF